MSPQPEVAHREYKAHPTFGDIEDPHHAALILVVGMIVCMAFAWWGGHDVPVMYTGT